MLMRTGKLQLAATAKARPTRNATFCFSNTYPEDDGDDADDHRRDLRDPHLSLFRQAVLGDDVRIEIMADGRGPSQREPGDDGEDRRERHRRYKAQEQRPSDGIREVHGRHVGAAEEPVDLVVGPAIPRLEIGGVTHEEGDGPKADDESEDVEVADEARGVEHRFARRLGVADCEEAHEDVRQAGRPEHEGEAERDRRDGVGAKATSRMNPK
jgi:hypothetical protein